MTDDTDLRCRIVNILFSQGYPDYAIAVGAFRHVRDIDRNKVPWPCGDGCFGWSDGSDLLIDASLSDDELSIITRHNILHIMLRHHNRRTTRQRTVWGVACDLEISHYYSVHDEEVLSTSPRIQSIYTIEQWPELDNLTAEELYDELIAKRRIRFLGNSYDEAMRLHDLSLDNHDEIYDKIAHRLSTNANLLDSEQRDLLEKSPLLHNIQQAGPPIDGLAVREKPVPANVKLQYSLRRYFLKQQNVEKGRSYRRPNKKYANSGIIAKARTNRYKPTKTLVVYVDISGSMTKEKLSRALGVTTRLDKLKRVRLITHYFDTAIRSEFRPGGGTDYNCVFNHAKANKFTCLALITDSTSCNFKDHYQLDALWIAGIEPFQQAKYEIENEINTPRGHITTSLFRIEQVEDAPTT